MKGMIVLKKSLVILLAVLLVMGFVGGGSASEPVSQTLNIVGEWRGSHGIHLGFRDDNHFTIVVEEQGDTGSLSGYYQYEIGGILGTFGIGSYIYGDQVRLVFTDDDTGLVIDLYGTVETAPLCEDGRHKATIFGIMFITNRPENMVYWAVAGSVPCTDDCQAPPAVAAPDVAGRILDSFDVNFRYEAGTIEHKNGTLRVIYENYISMVAQQMNNGASFPAYNFDGQWDGKTYVEKYDVDAYYQAVYNYLVGLGAPIP
jgi:hypothetical protein